MDFFLKKFINPDILYISLIISLVNMVLIALAPTFIDLDVIIGSPITYISEISNSVVKKEGQNFNIYNMKCRYRNCNINVVGRPNKKFCKVQCKRNELKYKQRDKKKLNRNEKVK